MVYLTFNQVWSSELPPESFKCKLHHQCHHERHVSFLSFPVTKKNPIKSSEKPKPPHRRMWVRTRRPKEAQEGKEMGQCQHPRNPCLHGAPSVSLAIFSSHCQIYHSPPLIQTNRAWVYGCEGECMFRFVSWVFFIPSTDRIPMMQLFMF